MPETTDESESGITQRENRKDLRYLYFKYLLLSRSFQVALAKRKILSWRGNARLNNKNEPEVVHEPLNIRGIK